MTNPIRTRIMERYKTAEIDVQHRVMLLVSFLLLALVLLGGLLAMNIVLARQQSLVTIMLVLVGFMACAVVALVFTVRGSYFVGANISALMAALGLSALLLTQAPSDASFITNLYYFPVVILLSTLFSRPRWTVFITLILAATAAGSYFLGSGVTLSGGFGHFLQQSAADFGFSMVFVFVLSFLIIRVNARVTAQAVANEHMATLVESADDAIVGITVNRTISAWNKAAQRVFEYSAKEAIGQPTSLIIPAELENEVLKFRERLARGEVLDNIETRIMRKNGAPMDLSLTLSAVRDATGRLVAFTSVARDVTAKKALDAQIARTQRLESLATLAGGVAHQFNNINAVVMVYLDVLRSDTTLSARLSSYAEAIHASVKKAVAITDRLLMLTEPRSPIAATVRLDALTRAIVSLNEKRMGEQNVRLVLELSATPPVAADESRLTFVLSCLIDNAVDSLLDRAAPMLTVRTGSQNETVYFEVEDTGCGVPEKDLPRLFTPFFSAKGEWAPPGSPQARLKGVGLGLAVSDISVSEYGGRIEVRSTEGKGSTFRVVLPARGRAT